MSDEAQRVSEFGQFKSVKRKTITFSQTSLVETSYLDPATRFPLVIRPCVDTVNLVIWAANNRSFIEDQLLQHGAILFRGFKVRSAASFQDFIEAVSGASLEYMERSSPRSQISGHIYTSTDYPPDQVIFLHNEQSYNLTFPMKIYFYCEKEAEEGGETPIADCRKVIKRISPQILDRFRQNKYMYVRNYEKGVGLSWQEVFQTTSPGQVEEYCLKNQIEWEWKTGGRLRTRQVREVTARHPRSGEEIWFNHMTFFHKGTLSEEVREAMEAEYGEEGMPNQTYYGDGREIEREVMEEIREAYEEEKVKVKWERGDVMMLDNMMSSHGRERYRGERKVLVGMAEPFTRDENK